MKKMYEPPSAITTLVVFLIAASVFGYSLIVSKAFQSKVSFAIKEAATDRVYLLTGLCETRFKSLGKDIAGWGVRNAVWEAHAWSSLYNCRNAAEHEKALMPKDNDCKFYCVEASQVAQ